MRLSLLRPGLHHRLRLPLVWKVWARLGLALLPVSLVVGWCLGGGIGVTLGLMGVGTLLMVSQAIQWRISPEAAPPEAFTRVDSRPRALRAVSGALIGLEGAGMALAHALYVTRHLHGPIGPPARFEILGSVMALGILWAGGMVWNSEAKRRLWEAGMRELWRRRSAVLYAEGRGFAPRFRHLLDVDPDGALEVLNQASPQQLRQLGPDDLVPFLTSNLPRARVVALTALHQAEGTGVSVGVVAGGHGGLGVA